MKDLVGKKVTWHLVSGGLGEGKVVKRISNDDCSVVFWVVETEVEAKYQVIRNEDIVKVKKML